MKEEPTNPHETFGVDRRKHLEQSKDSLRVPESYFDSRVVLLESALKQEFEVPADYFEQQQRTLSDSLQQVSRNDNSRSIRLWVSLAAAAMIAGVIYLMVPGKEQTVTFSEQLEQTPIEFEDLEQIEFDEEVYEEFIILDTVKPDTTSPLKKPVSIEDFKPSKGQSVISWDDIDADDIEEFLKDEESLPIIDEL
jgi:hypothetical protein